MNAHMSMNMLLLVALLSALSAIATQPLDRPKLLEAATLPRVFHGHFQNMLLNLARSEAKQSSRHAQQATSYLSTGYVYIQLSDLATDRSCRKTSMQLGLPVNTCIVSDTISYMVQLATDSCADASLCTYEDTTCTSGELSYPLDGLDEACNEYTGDTEIAYRTMTGNVPIHFWQLHCTAQPTKPLAVDSAVVELFSDELTCGNYVGFTSLAPDLCFPVNNGAFSVAVRCDRSGTVNLVQYLGGTCSLAFGSTPYAATCTAASNASPLARTQPTTIAAADPAPSFADTPQQLRSRPGNGGNSGGTGGGHQPVEPEDPVESGEGSDPEEGSSGGEGAVQLDPALLMGTSVAAFKTECGHSNVNYAAIVAVTQTLAGVSIADYLASAVSFSLVLQQTIADSVAQGVTVQDIYLTAVTAYTEATGGGSSGSSGGSAGPHSSSGAGAMQSQRVLATSAISVSYTIMPYGVTLTNADIATLLETAIDTGAFDRLLHTYAASANVPVLSGASSSGVSVNSFGTDSSGGGDGGDGTGGDPEDPVLTSGGESDNSGSHHMAMSMTVIICLAAGGAVLLAIAAAAYWYLNRKATSQAATIPVLSTPAGHPSASAPPLQQVQMCTVQVHQAHTSGDQGTAPVAEMVPSAVACVATNNVMYV